METITLEKLLDNISKHNGEKDESLFESLASSLSIIDAHFRKELYSRMTDKNPVDFRINMPWGSFVCTRRDLSAEELVRLRGYYPNKDFGYVWDIKYSIPDNHLKCSAPGVGVSFGDTVKEVLDPEDNPDNREPLTGNFVRYAVDKSHNLVYVLDNDGEVVNILESSSIEIIK